MNIVDSAIGMSVNQVTASSPKSSPNPPHYEMVKERRGENRVKFEAQSRVNSFRKPPEKREQTEILVPINSFDLVSKGPSALMYSLYDTDNKTKRKAKLE